VHGGAVSTDEATVTFQDIVDNMMTMRQWLKVEFGVEPRVGWQLDAFGHSSTNAELFSEIGLESMVFARMPHELKEQWKDARQMDFIWKPSLESEEQESD
jgi:hypothetical protein